MWAAFLFTQLSYMFTCYVPMPNFPFCSSIHHVIRTDASAYNHVLYIQPDQLNLDVFPPYILQPKPLLLFVESYAWYRSRPHHKKKVAFLISAQRHFALECEQNGWPVKYIVTNNWDCNVIDRFLDTNPQTKLVYMEPSEWDARQYLRKTSLKHQTRVTEIANNFFIARKEEFTKKIKPGYRLENFYRTMRKQTKLLMDGEQPLGGQWNYDTSNRKALPKNIQIPEITSIKKDEVTEEVLQLVAHQLPENFGDLYPFEFAVTRNEALKLADDFMQNRLANFGPYEDAIKTGSPFLFHSVLSPYLNNGLLLPEELCQMAEASYCNGHAPLASVEGFIRQILGWREYVRIYYEAQMPHVRTSNFFNFTAALPQVFWKGNSGLACVDDAVGHVLNHAYSHHIQRLMVLSNFSNLTESNPIELNDWFYFAYADAWEWVVLPNVLGMSTFADGGVLASKPYVAGGNYINKMSDCCKTCMYDVKKKTGENACPLNYLYWNFVNKHREVFNENGRVSFMVNMFDKKDENEKVELTAQSEKFISSLPR